MLAARLLMPSPTGNAAAPADSAAALPPPVGEARPHVRGEEDFAAVLARLRGDSADTGVVQAVALGTPAAPSTGGRPSRSTPKAPASSFW